VSKHARNSINPYSDIDAHASLLCLLSINLLCGRCYQQFLNKPNHANELDAVIYTVKLFVIIHGNFGLGGNDCVQKILISVISFSLVLGRLYLCSQTGLGNLLNLM